MQPVCASSAHHYHHITPLSRSLLPPSSFPPTFCSTLAYAWISDVHARAHEESPHARVCTRTPHAGQVRVRLSASKPLEVETLRKYSADGETYIFSSFIFFLCRALFSPFLTLSLPLKRAILSLFLSPLTFHFFRVFFSRCLLV